MFCHVHKQTTICQLVLPPKLHTKTQTWRAVHIIARYQTSELCLNCGEKKKKFTLKKKEEKTTFDLICLPARGVATSIAEPLLASVAIHHTGRIMNATVTMGRKTIISCFLIFLWLSLLSNQGSIYLGLDAQFSCLHPDLIFTWTISYYHIYIIIPLTKMH